MDALAGQAKFLLDEKRMFRISFFFSMPVETTGDPGMYRANGDATGIKGKQHPSVREGLKISYVFAHEFASGYILVNWLNKSFGSVNDLEYQYNIYEKNGHLGRKALLNRLVDYPSSRRTRIGTA